MNMEEHRSHPFGAHYCAELDALVGAIHQVSLAGSLQEITTIVCREARKLTGAEGAAIVLRENNVCHYADEDAISRLWKGMRFPMEICVSGWVMQHGQAVRIEDVYADQRVPHEAFRATFVKSMLMVPVRVREPAGALGCYWAHRHRPGDDELRLLQALADTASVAMEKLQAYAELEQRIKERTAALESESSQRRLAEETVQRMAIRDPLTGLLNRSGFFLQASQGLKMARRSGSQILLVVAGIDGLEEINEILGHDTGDRMIADAADVLRLLLRKSDILARVGGNQFAAFTLDDHDPVAVQNRAWLAVDKFNEWHARPYQLSLSIGLVSCEPQVPGSLEQLLETADADMCRDKQRKSAPGHYLH